MKKHFCISTISTIIFITASLLSACGASAQNPDKETTPPTQNEEYTTESPNPTGEKQYSEHTYTGDDEPYITLPYTEDTEKEASFMK